MKVTLKKDKNRIELIGHFDDKTKCSAATSMIYLVQNIEDKRDNLVGCIQEDGHTYLEVAEPTIAFETLKKTLVGWVEKYPNDIRLVNFID